MIRVYWHNAEGKKVFPLLNCNGKPVCYPVCYAGEQADTPEEFAVLFNANNDAQIEAFEDGFIVTSGQVEVLKARPSSWNFTFEGRPLTYKGIALEL